VLAGKVAPLCDGQEIGGEKRVTQTTKEEKDVGHEIGVVEHDC
jgi:hypothetical protein